MTNHIKTNSELYYKIMCGSCKSEIIVTGFSNGVFRWLCTGCRSKMYTKDNGELVFNYSIQEL